jgi:hypothetical protein
MKFKLIRPIFDDVKRQIADREMQRQDILLSSLKRDKLKELAAVVKAIKEREYPQNLVRKKLPGGLGYGMFLHPKAKPILRRHVIVSYSGELYFIPQNRADDTLYAFELLSDILLTKEEQAHYDPKRRYHARRLYALYVDAQKTGNFARFINHSHEPNLSAELFKIPKNSFGLDPSPVEVVYLTKKKIEPGEQLLVSYDGDNNSYWGARGMKPLLITPQTFKLSASLRVIGSLK